MPDDRPIILQTGSDESGHADAAVIWLHGLGADGNDFVPVVAELALPASLSIRFIFPHAPVRPITINGGYPMRGWYDITSLDIANRDDVDGITDSGRLLAGLCDEQIALGVPAERIIVAGFSQGGAVALHAGLRYAKRLGGIIALSTYLPMRQQLETEAAAENRDTPVFLAHGRSDEVIALQFGLQTRELLTQLNYPVQWQDYAMGHSVCAEEIADISDWLSRVLVA